LKEFSRVPLTYFFKLDTRGPTRGHLFKLIRHFFPERVINRWNMLEDDTVLAKTLNTFKTKLEKERKKKMSLFMDSSPLGI